MKREQAVSVVSHKLIDFFSLPPGVTDTLADSIILALENAAPHHIAHIDEDGWTLEHSMKCRLAGELGSCHWNEWLRGFDEVRSLEGWVGDWAIIDNGDEPYFHRLSEVHDEDPLVREAYEEATWD